MEEKIARIKELRMAMGLTIKDVSRILLAPYRTIQDWDRGERRPPDWLENIVLDELKRRNKRRGNYNA